MLNSDVMRRYSVSDAVMIDYARRAHSQYPEYAEGFAALDSDTFDETFHADFGTKIDRAADMPSDDVLLGTYMSESEDVTSARQHIGDLLAKAKYYVKKASQGDQGFYKAFAYHNLNDVRNSNVKIIDHISKFNTTVNAKKDKLLAAKMPEELIAELEAAEVAILKEREEQHKAKLNRSEMTTFRVIVLNRVWDSMALLADACQFAHPDNTTAKEIFSLPYPESHSSNEEIAEA